MIMKSARRGLLTIGAGLASASLIFTLTAAPAGAAVEVSPLSPTAVKVPVTYVGLGDSYAAGTGGGPTVQSPFLPPECVQTAKAYPTQLGGTNLGCFGATTGDVVTIASALSSVLATSNEVSVTVGGNDVGAGAVSAACTADPGATCSAALAQVDAALPTLTTNIGALVPYVRRLAPNADVIVTGYPRLFTIASTTPEPLRTLAIKVNAMTDKLNAAIRTGATQAGARFVDVTSRFNAHGIGSDNPWINYQPGVLNQETFHPNAAGYSYGYRPAVNTALKK